MSHNQSRAERTEPSSANNRKPNRSGLTQQRSFSGGGGGKGGGGGGASAPPHPLSNQSRSFKKYNNVQGGQARTGGPGVNLDSSSSQTTIQNGAITHVQQPSPGTEVPVTSAPVKPTDVSTPRTARTVPKAPSSNAPPASSEASTLPTPAKGEASRSFPLQFGSISPGLMNGMQIPARTSSAPPNLDEQKRAQARHEAARAVPALPTPSIPKQQLQKKDAGTVDHPNVIETRLVSKSKREGQVSVVPPGTQTQKPSVHHGGRPLQMSFHQAPVPLQFGGPAPQLQSQPMSATSMPMPMGVPIPLTLGNPQVQQSLFVSGLQPHLMQSQGLIHQGQGLNFSSPMAPQVPPQLGNIGINMGPQFPQQQAGKVGGLRKVKITHPDTHEELRFDGSSGPRPHPNMPPQSQPIPSAQHAPINYHSKSYTVTPHYFPAGGSVPVNNTQKNPSSQPPRSHTQVTVKAAGSSRGEKDTVSSSSSHAIPKAESPKGLKPSGEDSVYPQKGFDTSSQSSLQHLEPGIGPSSILVSVESKQSAGVLASEPVDSAAPNSLSSISAPPVENSLSAQRHEKIGEPALVDDQPKKPVDRDGSIMQDQVGEVSSAPSSLSSEHMEAELTTPTVTREVRESGVEPSSTATLGTLGSSGSMGDHVLAGNSYEPLQSFGRKIKESKLSEPETLSEVIGNLTLADCSVPASQSLTSPKDSGQIESQSLPKVTALSNEGSSLGIPEEELEDSAGGFVEDEKRINKVVASTLISEDKDSTTCPSTINTPAYDDQTSTLNAPASSIQDQIDFKEASDTKSTILNEDNTSVLGPSPSEDNLKPEHLVSESKSSNLFSQSSGVNEKSLLGPNVTRSAVPRGKKKIKELSKKADAAGATSDLYMAYKGPEEKKETVISVISTEMTSCDEQISPDLALEDVIPTEIASQSKMEPDDWEDADFSTPKLEPPENVKEVSGGTKVDDDGEGLVTKKYSRDFLLKFSEQFTELPEGFEITSDIAEALMISDANVSRDLDHSFGRVIDRPMSGSRPDRRGSGMGDEEKWSKQPGPLVSGLDMRFDIGPGGHVMGFRPGQGGGYAVLRNPRVMPQYPGPILPGLMQPLAPQVGLQRNNSDSERWQRGTAFQKGLMPSPPTPQTPLQMMHRAERKYLVGKVSDEEEAKQRQLKAILNKLTPQNFEKLFEQVKQVNIDNVVTLTGVISQIFDKALMEPTFCEMYANFCYHLAAELPDLSVDKEKITFKRLLLNKCQEEFERGEREEEEAKKADEEGEVKQSEEEREEKRLRARRRMLGNIRLIGELYKKRMLTERIMHECIKKLLGGPRQVPDEEDIEALCKLMSTIGEMIDHPRAKEHMDAYFDRMAKLSTNMKLSSRVRFMLLDAIDLRKNKWQQRRKVEGPKKIEEVHRDAAQERQAQASRLARTPSSIGNSGRRGQPMDFAPRGSSMLSPPSSQIGGLRAVPPQFRGFGVQDARFGERHPLENRTLSVPLPQRTDDSITLGPQGGLGRGMSFRGQPSPSVPLVDVPSPGDSRRVASGLNGNNSIPDRAAYGSREDPVPRYMPERFASSSVNDQLSFHERNMNYGNRDARNTDHSFDRTRPTSPPVRGVGTTSSCTISTEKAWTEERLREMSMSTIKEFYSAKDENEVVLCIKDLNAPSFHPSMISLWVTDSFERKDMERDLLARLLVNLAKSRDHVVSQDQLIKGFESVLMTLEDAVNDAPKAAEYLGRVLAKVISENVISLAEIGQLIYEGGEEQGRLVEIGLAGEVLGSIFETIKSEKGDSILTDICTSSNLPLESFRPRGSNKSWRLDKFI